MNTIRTIVSATLLAGSLALGGVATATAGPADPTDHTTSGPSPVLKSAAPSAIPLPPPPTTTTDPSAPTPTLRDPITDPWREIGLLRKSLAMCNATITEQAQTIAQQRRTIAHQKVLIRKLRNGAA